MTEILLLGTFHFMEKDWDVCSGSTQNEIDALARKLAAFKPDAVAVEGAVHQQSVIDEAYARVRLSDFDNEAYMRTAQLGQISMFGQTAPITFCNECVQIGFRLARLAGLSCVHAIDADIILDDAPLGGLPEGVSRALERLQAYISSQEDGSLISSYRALNSDEFSRLNHLIYLETNAFNPDGQYGGSSYVAQWYTRNLRIFAELQALSRKYSRIFVLYGAGHLQILRDLIRASDTMTLADPNAYL